MKKLIASTALLSTLTLGAVSGDHYLNPKYSVGKERLTPAQYVEKRPEIVRSMRVIPTHAKLQAWIDMVVIENKRCPLTIYNVTGDELILEVQKEMERRLVNNFRC